MIRKKHVEARTLPAFMDVLALMVACHPSSTLELNGAEAAALLRQLEAATADGPTREKLTAELHDAQAAIMEIFGPSVPVGVFDTVGDLVRAIGEMKRVEYQDLAAAHGEAISRLRSLEAKFNELNGHIETLQKERDEWRDKANAANFTVFNLQTKLDTAGIEENRLRVELQEVKGMKGFVPDQSPAVEPGKVYSVSEDMRLVPRRDHVTETRLSSGP